MTKALEIYPEILFAKGQIDFTPIPVNAYSKSLAEEKKLFSKDDFVTIYHDMMVLRTFETIINEIKLKGEYQGVKYNHAGPAHLSLGQECGAVGQAYALDVNDHIFGSHRSHSEILAKGLSAIRKLDDAVLDKIMRDFFGGATLKVVEKNFKGSVKDLARHFLIYGAYAEIFARTTGFNKGWGGSMHAFFTPFGIYPNNAIVGGSGSVSPGAALFKRVNRKPGIVVCNIGDASFGCGPVWEGMMFAAMAQYRNLWDKELGGGLPLLVNCFNNQYGMGGQTNGETMGYELLARIGAGVNPEQMHAERVNGYNPLAVIDAVQRKKQILLEGRGPVLLDVATYRISGHSPSDASSYRSKEELDRWIAADAIPAFAKKIVDGKIASQADLDKVSATVQDLVFDMFKLAIDKDISPYETMESKFIETVTFSNQKIEKFDDRAPEFLQKLEDNEQYKRIQAKERFFEKDGKPVPKMKLYNYSDAVFEAMVHRYGIDPTMVAFGEENRDWGGAFACYRGLTELLPYHRLFNSPISEAAIVGAAVGYALCGGRAVAELMYCDFLGRAGDEVFNQLSKWQAMSGGILKMPVVLRISVGFKYGAQHSQDWTAMVNHIPGLKVVYPVTPYDAKGLLNSALAGSDPVIFLESQQLYGNGEMFHQEGVPEGYYEIEIGDPDVKRAGKDLTIITFGPALFKALDAAKKLEADHGISAEVIDLRSVNPLKYDKIIESVKKTGKVVLVNEAVERGNVMHNIAANISQFCFDYLDAPPVVIGARNWVSPAAELESKYFPQTSWILDSIHERIMPLKGYTPTSNRSLGELQRINTLGV
ncbi:alpha-ketoacid dehydrogenase subunit alpha/beta [Oligosphaera ethanolica]|uniref:2-oxoisovalerate dehydrogenase E1 component n=1 Tax=Oligosphaera ethanolica TaxID=760260 RepID=A0AAE3VGW3_9BACT|nr:alpha-ketoacid dehydrogenase subunit alpha/beta [Oligosphaera ethanolica]MDQ0290210.1 2-oxoisovalerate dehydrogenase E1 component [Oligosphaera ethanolica]